MALTWKAPLCEFAVIAGEVAMPLASLVTVVGPANMTLAPLEGGVKVTGRPAIGFWYASSTIASSGEP